MTDTVPPNIDIVAANKLEESPIPSANAPPDSGFDVGDSFKQNANLNDAGINTPPPSSKLDNTTGSGNGFRYTSPEVNFEEDAPGYLKAKVESLVYWEYPKKTGIFLVSTLGVLVLTQYYSLLQIVAGLFTIVTGVNWVFVNTHKQGQRFIGGKAPSDVSNPHSSRLETKGTYIPRERVLRTAQLTVDVVEAITQQITKLVLIENNWYSAVSLIASYFVWTLAKYISTKYLVGIFILSAFSFPRLYLQHQDVVDAHVAQQSDNARKLATQYGGVAGQKVKELAEQAKVFLKNKTGSTTTLKENKAE